MLTTGLVLEGGGLRCVFTGGVLEYFMEQSFYVSYVIGVSAGACSGTSYVSRQRGRNKQVTIGYVRDPRYISYLSFLRGKGLLGMDFLFDEIPNKLVPLDRLALKSAVEKMIVVATDCETGNAVYFDKDVCSNYDEAVRASSSLPFVTPSVELDGMILVDGGVADSIPIRKSIADGNQKNIIILTRERGYRKPVRQSSSIKKWLIKRYYHNYPNLIKALELRNQRYNETLDYIEELEKQGKVLIIQPKAPVTVNRLDKDTNKLEEFYLQGYKQAANRFQEIVDFTRSI
ncbi:patatin family protein [Desulfuribacillus alkaliarsenatis]|uniref:Patatin family protein n=1 Tax=Desulfuribacillus alkaliarsenatis TaxID=766136 RepID=A0A1E5FZT4_9FIRM|nr:patatin family protein [Desulfuribacillus alkaliarsenatis]